MLIPFHILKVVQASAVLLKTEPGRRMSRLRLLKLLYIADRESLQERTRPITGDDVVAMDHGPVLSHTYDLIKGADYTDPLWEQFVRPSGARDLELAADPGVGKLSRHEITKLQDVATRFMDKNDWEVAEYTHTVPEWQKNQPPRHSSKPIPLDDLLDATGLSERKDDLLARERSELTADRLFSS
jgi:uncharacterized phage-associated protein